MAIDPAMPAGGVSTMDAKPPVPPAPVPMGGGPTPSPMTTPQPNEGLQKAARVNVQMAIKVLQREVPNFPFDSDEGKAIMGALRTLGNAFGKSEDKDRELIPAEILQLLSAVGGMKPGMGKPPIPGMGPAPAAAAGGMPQIPPMA